MNWGRGFSGPLGLRACLLAAAALQLSCDPCGATFSCMQKHRAVVIGSVLDPASGVGVAGVAITAVYDSGVAMSPSTLRATTRSDGYFRLDGEAAEAGRAWVNITVSAPNAPPYVIARFPIQAAGITGDAAVIGPLVSARPEIPFVVQVVDRATGTPIRGAAVEFTRGAGPRLIVGDRPVRSIGGVTGDGGVTFFFLGSTSDTTGTMFGQFAVRRTPATLPFTFRGYSVSVVPGFKIPINTIRLDVP